MNLRTWGQEGQMRSKAFLLPAQQDRICHPYTFFIQPLEGTNPDFIPSSPYILQLSEENRRMGKNTEN